MANYKAATPDEIVIKGGRYDGESGMAKKKCVTYDSNISSWLSNHGCSFNNTTGISYSSGQVLCINDVQVSAQHDYKYLFYNYEKMPPMFIYATNLLCDNTINLGSRSWGGSAIIQNEFYDGYTYHPANADYRNIFCLSSEWHPDSYRHDFVTGITYVYINGVEYDLATFTDLQSQGTIPYTNSETGLHDGKSLFCLTNHITVDFKGANCRNKYFSFYVGQDEFTVLGYAKGTPPGVTYQMGWNTPRMIGYSNKNYLNGGYAKFVDYNNGLLYDLYDYKSIDSIRVANLGFTILFKDTTQTNDYKEETFVVGYNLDNNTWNTTNYGFLFTCKNFTMS